MEAVLKVKERDLVLDNLSGTNKIFSYIYAWIYGFHMPAFILVSGYLSKNAEKSARTAFGRFLVPYIPLNMLMGRFQNGHWRLDPLTPRNGFWYLWNLFIWRLMLPVIDRMGKWKSLIMLFVLALVTPMLVSVNIGGGHRLLGMWFFFALGYWVTPEFLERLRKLPKVIPAAVLAAGSVLLLGAKYKGLTTVFFYYRESYADSGLSTWQGAVLRTGAMILAICMTAALYCLTSGQRSVITRCGEESLTIYELHLFMLLAMKACMDHFGWRASAAFNFDDWLIYIAITAVMLVICTVRPVSSAYKAIWDKVAVWFEKPGKTISK